MRTPRREIQRDPSHDWEIDRIGLGSWFEGWAHRPLERQNAYQQSTKQIT
jgi:hypothetical protein